MFTLIIHEPDLWNEETCEFVSGKEHKFRLEHSLISISNWETEFERSFMNEPPKTPEEWITYVKAMVIKPELTDDIAKHITMTDLQAVERYINRRNSASRPHRDDKHKKGSSKSYVTSEQIYSWMVAYRIPFEAAKWPFQRLWNLIQFCEGQQKKPKKYTAQERKAIVAANRAKLHTRG